ncbi:hypothetical protein DXG01_008350, partial [Tephrocybe rancida]
MQVQSSPHQGKQGRPVRVLPPIRSEHGHQHQRQHSCQHDVPQDLQKLKGRFLALAQEWMAPPPVQFAWGATVMTSANATPNCFTMGRRPDAGETRGADLSTLKDSSSVRTGSGLKGATAPVPSTFTNALDAAGRIT